MSRRLPLLVLVAGAVAIARAGQGEPPQVFRTSVDAVRVDALVTRRGAPVGGLDGRDFELLDNGVPQRVTYVGVEAVPINVVLVLDVSQSVAGERLESLRTAGRAAIDALRPIDRAAVLTFADAITEQVPLTADRTPLRSALDNVSAGGTTALYDATRAALLLGVSEGARTLVLIFSDGMDTASWLDSGVVLEAAAHSDAVAYAVTSDRGDPQWLDRAVASPTRQVAGEWVLRPPPHEFLDRLAETTAGRVLHADTGRLARAFAGIVREFQNRYLLLYSPSGVDAHGWHSLTVRLRDRHAEVQARRGYWR